MPIRYNTEQGGERQVAGVQVTDELSERLRRQTEAYVRDDDPAVREHLEWFQDQKLGLMIHFGLYSQLGMKESWPLIDESAWGDDPTWTRWQFPPDQDPAELKRMYAQLHRSFNPLRFDPDEWADFARDTGFKYLLFTTKHHDGFCMWDTKTTDYRVTGPESPYRDNRNADMTRCLYDAFRARGLGISVYFSKPDWGSPLYWEPGYWMQTGIRSTAPSYSPAEKPALWERFVQYTHAQLRELGLESGKIDCMWFDGGAVSARNGLDVRIGEIISELRRTQPWLLCADRGQGGLYENFLTPELEIPETVLPVPWETCLCLGKRGEGERYTSFGYTYDQEYFTASETLHIFLEIVSRGGNLALNIGPQPDGRLSARALHQLEPFGRWMRVHGRGIYGTRPCAPYFTGAFRYLQKGDKCYVYRLYEDDEPATASVTFDAPFPASRVVYMRTGAPLDFRRDGEKLTVTLPEGIVGLQGLMADGFEVLG